MSLINQIRIINYNFVINKYNTKQQIKHGAGRLYINSSDGVKLTNKQTINLIKEELINRFPEENLNNEEFHINIIKDRLSNMYCVQETNNWFKKYSPIILSTISVIIGGIVIYKWANNSDVNIVNK
jgi:hypothetical protein